MKRSIAILALSVMVAFEWAELEYKGLDLGKDDSLLFSARVELPGEAPTIPCSPPTSTAGGPRS